MPRATSSQHSSFSSARSAQVYSALHPRGDPFAYDSDRDPKLELIGLLLWATEGDKTQLSLANGNSAIIRKYLEFLRVICRFDEKRIKAVIHYHDTLSYARCLHYWSAVTGIPTSRFNRPFIKKDTGGTRSYPYGIVRIVATNVKLVHRFKERLAALGLPP